MGREDLTNGQWARLEPLLPRGIKWGRPRVWTRRQLVDGIRWRTRTGAPWRDVPERYGPWDRVYDLFRRWQRDGTLARIQTRLQAEADAKGLITWDVNVDSTVCRAHRHAAGAAKKGTARSGRRAAGRTLPTRAGAAGCTRPPRALPRPARASHRGRRRRACCAAALLPRAASPPRSRP
ncbi:IS5 family transposase [Streptomyces sp. NPDC012751]|uniref:IS5 family transposase n=1 Tax=Streptomyces sp. NPDC012751 TaxID=3364846 RepID=UPI00369733D2